MVNSVALEVAGIKKKYNLPKKEIYVLRGIDLAVNTGQWILLTGQSGCGKTTLLHILGTLDSPDDGTMHCFGQSVCQMSNYEKSRLRRVRIGFVFQSFQLISTLTALENVMVPIELRNETDGALSRAKELMGKVGLVDRIHHYPLQLSGGEQQRVGLARAFVNHPKILFADEPTGNLDNETGSIISDLLFDLNKQFGTTLIIVTHNLEIAERSDRIIKLKSGQIESS